MQCVQNTRLSWIKTIKRARAHTHNDDYNKILRVEGRSWFILWAHLPTGHWRRDTCLAPKVVPFVQGDSVLHSEHRVHRERRIALPAKLLSETCSATVRLDTTKSPPIRSAVFRRSTALCGKFSKPGEKMRERGAGEGGKSFADSLKLLLSTPSASPAEATAPSCN